MHINRLQAILIGVVVALSGYWLFILSTGSKDGFHNFFFSFLFGLIPLIGGLIGMYGARIWGWLSSTIGRAVFFISLGSFLWGAGEMVWSYYNFFADTAAPYPSLADIGFGPSIAFWLIGTFYLAKACGAKYGLRSTATRATIGLIVLAVIGFSWYLQIHVARDGVLLTAPNDMLKVVLDIIYPLGDALALVVAVVVFGASRKYLGGRYRLSILALLFGLAVMYFADFTFSYTTTTETYYNADWGDWFLMFGNALIVFGALGFAVRPKLTKKSTSPEVS